MSNYFYLVQPDARAIVAQAAAIGAGMPVAEFVAANEPPLEDEVRLT